MARYLVSYDLNDPPARADYHPLIVRIRDGWNGERVLYSEWFVNTESSAKTIRDDLQGYIDSNDGLMVLALTGEAAWTTNGVQMTAEAIKAKLAA